MVGNIIAAIMIAHIANTGPKRVIAMSLIIGSIMRIFCAIMLGRPNRSNPISILIIYIIHHDPRITAKKDNHSVERSM